MTPAQAGLRQARWAGLSLIAIGSVHLALFLVQAAWLGHLDGWVRGELRSMSTRVSRSASSRSGCCGSRAGGSRTDGRPRGGGLRFRLRGVCRGQRP